MATEATREGFHTITPYLVSPDPRLIEWIQRVLGAEETWRTAGGAGGVHIELRLGDSMLMVGHADGVEPFPAMLHVTVGDVDALHERAVAAGATSLEPPADRPDGERRAGVRDPFGNVWHLAAPTAGR
jgi:uncharacterized glyoxalase superfamily protein PhnB